jgi:hypothetical protein
MSDNPSGEPLNYVGYKSTNDYDNTCIIFKIEIK